MIGDLPIKKGTTITAATTINLYNPDYFEDPLKFRPERWENPRYDTAEMQKMTELMFSAGPRTCIGKQLAQL